MLYRLSREWILRGICRGNWRWNKAMQKMLSWKIQFRHNEPSFDILACMWTWRIKFAFINVLTCLWVVVELHSPRTRAIEATSRWRRRQKSSISLRESISITFFSLPAGKVHALMTTWVWMMRTFIDIDATRSIRWQLVTQAALTVKWSDGVVAMSLDTRWVEALVNIVTVEFVMAENKAVRTSTFVRSFRVDADVRAVVNLLTLIHIVTSMIVGAQHKAGLAGTTVWADQINADVRTVSVVLHALVDISAWEAVLVQLVAVMTWTKEAALGVVTALLATVKNVTTGLISFFPRW